MLSRPRGEEAPRLLPAQPPRGRWADQKQGELPGGMMGFANVVNRATSVVERDLKKKIKFWAEYGKGSANVLVDWTPAPIAGYGMNPGPWRIAISSCHLDSKSADKRAAQVQDAM